MKREQTCSCCLGMWQWEWLVILTWIFFLYVFCSSLFRPAALQPEQVDDGRFISRRISSSITYFYTPFLGDASCSAKDSEISTSPHTVSSPSPAPRSMANTFSTSSPSSSSLLSPTADSHQKRPEAPSTSRPLLLFFSWLGAQPGPVAKYRDLYLDRGMDVLIIQSSVMHFLWPRWGLNYGLVVLKLLEEPEFSDRAVLVHAASIGGYTFTQILTHIAHGQKEHSGLSQRVIGHIYDSLVVGTLEHMAIGEWKWSCSN